MDEWNVRAAWRRSRARGRNARRTGHEEHLGDGEVAVEDGDVERRLAVLVGRVDARAVLQEQVHDVRAPVIRGLRAHRHAMKYTLHDYTTLYMRERECVCVCVLLLITLLETVLAALHEARRPRQTGTQAEASATVRKASRLTQSNTGARDARATRNEASRREEKPGEERRGAEDEDEDEEDRGGEAAGGAQRTT